MSYGVEVYNQNGTQIVGPDSSMGSVIAQGFVPSDARYPAALAANPSWSDTNPFTTSAPVWYLWGELMDITISVPDFVDNALYEIIIYGPVNIFVGNPSVLSRQNGSFVYRRNDKYDAAWYIVRRG